MRILIIDSDAPCAEALSFALSNAGFDVEQALEARAGLDLLARGDAPDAVVVGHPLVERSALDVCRVVREERDVALIAMTGCAREETCLRLFAAGADDVMVKPVRVAELLARLKAILRRRGARGSDLGPVLEKGPFRLNASRLEVQVAGRPDPARLTPLEAKLLGLLMANANQVMTKARLQELIWGYQNDSSGDLLKTHVRHLRVKLEASPSYPRFIQTINGVGYTFVSPRNPQTAELSRPVETADLALGVPAAGSLALSVAGLTHG